MWLNLLIFLTINVILIKCNDDLKVCLENLGCLEGTEMPRLSGDNFEAFLGVPFAKSPIGDLRFRNPVPVESWQGVLSAKAAKPDCKQRNYLIPHWPIVGDEDCLYMNIYRPKGVLPENPLPVIFYIYGGGFFSGSSNPAVMGSEYFMDTREVLVVVITYRLGPFGFLSTGSSEMPGNFGLKDQLLALKWVNDHIKSFGGDPNQVTLFGHSAGASAVHFLMINPKAKGLFKQSILSSGNALAPYVGILDKPLEQLHTISQALGIESAQTQNHKDLADQLRTIEADKILLAGDSLKFWLNNILFNFRPVIEDASDTNAYLTEHPYETLRQGNYELKPWLTGLVSYKGEGAPVSLNIYDNLTLRAELNKNFDEIMMKMLDIKSQELLNRFIEEYMQGVHELNASTGEGFLELFSDYYFYFPVYKTLEHYLEYADIVKYPVYIYKFSYHGTYTYVPIYTAGSTNRYDVVHLDDLLYQFRQSALFPDFEKDSIDAKLSKEFVGILLEFVKTGKPLHYDDIGSCTKEQFLTSGSKGMCKYLEFINKDGGYKCVANNTFHVDRMKLWDEVMAFLGVPYAFPPKRFEPPIRYTSNKTHKVVKPQYDCVQKNYLIPNHPISGSEDCLYLNVYKPIIHRLALPVMVYIFGGGFFAGSAAPIFTGPEYLMDRGDVIVVTINYRLGAFGFLSTNDGNIPGNLGLKDQVMALSWVRENIPYFGGDRNRVTLFGQSAGAVSAHLHMLSKLSRNLFNAVITISGSANVPWAIDDDPETTFRLTCRYSNLTGWDTKTTERLTRELKVVPIYTLLDAGDKLKFFDVDIMVNYRPTIEPRGPEAFLDNNPAFIIKSGLYNAVPMLVGTVPNEGGVRVVAIMENEELKQAFNKDFYRIMVTFLEFPKRFNTTQIQKKMDLILNEYFGGVQELNNKTRQGFMDLVTDRGFHHPMYNAMKWFVKKNNLYITQLFLYVFDYRGRYTFANIFAGHPTPEYGVIHCDDLIYLFRAFRIFPDFPKNSSDAAAIKGYVDYLTYFAHWRQPPIEPTFKRCNDKNFFSGEGKICDYQEFVNGEEDEWVLLTDALPVMVYIHGGGFFSGTANPNVTGPQYIMNQLNVILVTLAYRLGPFGFLTTNDDAIPGNIGLKDQHVVNRHIYILYIFFYTIMISENLLSCCLMASMIFSLALQCLSDDPKVCATGVGCYIGTVMEYESKKFEAFLGIPYAFPPKRFEVAVPYESKETHQAKTAQEDCIQKNYLLPTKPITGSEDCLYLNIYRPQNISEALPVMVYIFGGGFFAGTASPIITGPEFIMQHNNIILVTLGYRLGPFGFLTTNDDSLPGNLGLKDQNMALEWVFEYIQFFGGDRSRTTLFGQSAGAVSAHLHMLSEKSKGLFYAIIALSGTANVPWAIDENPKETARLTAKYCHIKNWNKASTKKLKIALQKVSAEKLLNAGDHLKYWDVDNMVNYRPIVERPSPNAFLTEHPVNILHDGKYDPVPIMFGRVPNEGGVRVVAIMESDKLRNEFNKRFFELMEKFLELPTIFNTTEKTKQIIKEYFHGTNELNNDTQQNFMDLVTHRGFYHPLYNAIKMHVEKIDTNLYPVYMYKFNYQGTYTYADMYAGHPTGSKYGVVHCNDLIYLFRTSILFPDFKPDSNDAVVVEKFVDDFVYFAHFRKPKIYQKIKPCNKENFYPQEEMFRIQVLLQRSASVVLILILKVVSQDEESICLIGAECNTGEIGPSYYPNGSYAPVMCLHEVGCATGSLILSYHGIEWEAYLGIPYAFKPKRFEPAVPYSNKTKYDALYPKSDCLQKNYLLVDRPITGDEDCLYLNLYRPKDRPDVMMPVLVYLFGVGFFSNSNLPNTTGPFYILDHNDTIIITVSYRLGPFGFLATDDGVIPGNLGLKDQSEALRWVFKHADSFGGDRFRVTLMGHSAGAVAAHMHMFSKLSSHLFHAIIAISGTANVPFAIDENPTQTARLTAKYCNISNWDTINTHELKKALEEVDAHTLLNAGDHLKYWDVDNLVNYRPVIEDESPTAFITKHPKEYLRTGRYSPVPILFGRVPNEGGIRVVSIMESEQLKNQFNNNFTNLLANLQEYPHYFTSSQITNKTGLIIKEYLNESTVLNDNTKQGFMDLLTDRLFYHPLYNAVKMYVNTINTVKYPVYMYSFNYPGIYTFADKFVNHDTKNKYGIIHGDDFFFIFSTQAYFPIYAHNSTEAKALNLYIEDLLYFAHNRKPKHSVEKCNKVTFYPVEDRICLYMEYVKGPSGELIVKIIDTFDTKPMLYVKLLTCCFVTSLYLVIVQGHEPKICTFDAGCFIGFEMEGYQIEKFEAYLGIPYAVKPRRFHSPKRFYSSETFQAKDAKFSCIQKNYYVPGWRVTGDEDCLYLNVYRPYKPEASEFFPVIFYVHGGGFFAGSSAPIHTGPEYIMDNEHTVVVTIAYRLGAFGFLTTGDGVIPGNLGLKDQAEALRWVFRNIEAFSGDRFRITLVGQDAGAVSVHMHMFSKLTTRLFHAIVAISGTANAPFAIDDNPERTARETAKHCNITDWDTITTAQLAKALESVPMYVLLDAGDHLKYWDIDNLVNYKPIVERNVPFGYLIEHPDEYIRTGNYNPVPIMFGRVPIEGGLRTVGIMSSDVLHKDFNTHFFHLMVKFLEFPAKFDNSQKTEKTKLILDEYLNGTHELNEETWDGFMDLITHRNFYHPLYNTIKYYVETIDTKKYPVFLYNFNYIGNYSYSEVIAGHRLFYDYGVIHCDDLIYLLRQRLLFPDFPRNSAEATVVAKYVHVLTYFAHTTELVYIDSKFKPCNDETFFPSDGKMCDSFEFVNGENDSIVLSPNDAFDTKRMKFWDKILK
ncbi:hypothetical protein FF38_14079 [Lucilia cuprina]|uniref:carboxylesterase n=3 Tax=Lucilia cuprina TaxID=7375 RepID=A0A0L0BPU1_LUCCU|nr:hypothetical protein FF38_14079 [Lucilia cuprina]